MGVPLVAVAALLSSLTVVPLILNIDQYGSGTGRAAVEHRGSGRATGRQAGDPVRVREPRAAGSRALLRQADQHLRPGRDRPSRSPRPRPARSPAGHRPGRALGPHRHRPGPPPGTEVWPSPIWPPPHLARRSPSGSGPAGSRSRRRPERDGPEAGPSRRPGPAAGTVAGGRGGPGRGPARPGRPSSDGAAAGTDRVIAAALAAGDELRLELPPRGRDRRRPVADRRAGRLPPHPGPPPAGGGSIAGRLWGGLSTVGPEPGLVGVLDAALVAAGRPRAGRVDGGRPGGRLGQTDPYAVVSAGLATVSGTLHGGASLGIEALLDEVDLGLSGRPPWSAPLQSWRAPAGLRPPPLPGRRPAAPEFLLARLRATAAGVAPHGGGRRPPRGHHPPGPARAERRPRPGSPWPTSPP